jgi:hypothetical protein
VAKIEAKARAKPKEELDVPVYACLECFKKRISMDVGGYNYVHFHRTHDYLKIL